MKAMVLDRIASLAEGAAPLRLSELPTPVPGDHEVLVRVHACGVCHTELDEIEGRLRPPQLPVVLGHEVIGHVEARGSQAKSFAIGARVGVGWIHHSSGQADENLSPLFTATGCHVNGGYAQYLTVPQWYAVAIPESLSDTQAAPLMCAGAIGYRSLRLAAIHDGQPLGLMGFGASAHLVLQVARHVYPRSPVFVFHRSPEVREFARQLGADWAGDLDDFPPQALQAMIDTTPAWRPIVKSLPKLRPGGRLVINAIRKEDADKNALLGLSYHEHLWMEREIKSVANLTHRDIAEFLPLAGEIPLRPQVTLYPLEQANEALHALRRGGIHGAAVLIVD
jgi:propanol-preferring alcohol dehydrogenase